MKPRYDDGIKFKPMLQSSLKLDSYGSPSAYVKGSHYKGTNESFSLSSFIDSQKISQRSYVSDDKGEKSLNEMEIKSDVLNSKDIKAQALMKYNLIKEGIYSGRIPKKMILWKW